MRRFILLVAVLAAASAATGTALAAWSANSISASGNVKALSMPTGTAPTTPATSTGSVTLTWTAAQLAGSDLTTYNVTRYPAAGGAGTAITCSPQTLTVHTVSCTYAETTSGSYQYTDTPTKNLWVGAESAKSGTTVVTVDSTPPAVTINAVTTPSKVNKPAFSGAYGFATGDLPSVTVQVRAGTGSAGSVVATPVAVLNTTNHTWSTTALTTALADGTYNAQATQADAAGNSQTVSSTFVVDTTPPAPTVTSPASGAVLNSGAITISGTAGTATGDSATVSVSIATTGQPTVLTANVDQTTGAWSVSQSIGKNKSVTVTVTQTDSAGNSGSGSSSFLTNNT